MESATVFRLQYDPKEVSRLAGEYLATLQEDDRKMEEAGRRIKAGMYTRSNLEIVYRWKSVRRIGLLAKNSDAEIARALEQAAKAADIKEAVCSLISPRLHGIGVKMASAILTAIDPEKYTVLDYRALEALGVEDRCDLDFYVQYVEACQRMAKEFRVTLRDFDRANWQWSRNKDDAAGKKL